MFRFKLKQHHFVFRNDEFDISISSLVLFFEIQEASNFLKKRLCKISEKPTIHATHIIIDLRERRFP